MPDFADETRQLRDDVERLQSRLEAARDRRAQSTPARLGKVLSTGANLAVGKFVRMAPMTLTNADVEGATAGVTAGAGEFTALMLGPAAPATGDLLVCRFVEYRWVAEKPNPSTATCGVTITASDVGGPIVGATVVLFQSGSVVATATTGVSGVATFTVPPGIYDVQVTAAGHATQNWRAAFCTTIPSACGCGALAPVLYVAVPTPNPGWFMEVMPATLEWQTKPAGLKAFGGVPSPGYYSEVLTNSSGYSYRLGFACLAGPNGDYALSIIWLNNSANALLSSQGVRSWFSAAAGNACSPFSLVVPRTYDSTGGVDQGVTVKATR